MGFKLLLISLLLRGAIGDNLFQKPPEDKVLILGRVEVVKPKKIGFFTFHKRIRKGLFVVLEYRGGQTLMITDRNGLVTTIGERGCEPVVSIVGWEEGFIFPHRIHEFHIEAEFPISIALKSGIVKVEEEDLTFLQIIDIGEQSFKITSEGTERTISSGQRIYRDFLKTHPESPWAGVIRELLKAWKWRDKGDKSLDKGDTLSALSFYNKGMEIIKLPSLRKKLISIYDQQGKRDSVLELIQKGIEIESENPKRYREAGEYYHKYGMVDTAEGYYLKAIDVDSIDKDSWLKAAEFYNETGKREKAIVILKKGIEVLPEETSLYEKLGDLYLEGNKKREAMEMYERVYGLDPERWNIKDKLIEIYKELGEKEKLEKIKE